MQRNSIFLGGYRAKNLNIKSHRQKKLDKRTYNSIINCQTALLMNMGHSHQVVVDSSI